MLSQVYFGLGLGCLVTSLIWVSGVVSSLDHYDQSLKYVYGVLSFVWLLLSFFLVRAGL